MGTLKAKSQSLQAQRVSAAVQNCQMLSLYIVKNNTLWTFWDTCHVVSKTFLGIIFYCIQTTDIFLFKKLKVVQVSKNPPQILLLHVFLQ